MDFSDGLIVSQPAQLLKANGTEESINDKTPTRCLLVHRIGARRFSVILYLRSTRHGLSEINH